MLGQSAVEFNESASVKDKLVLEHESCSKCFKKNWTPIPMLQMDIPNDDIKSNARRGKRSTIAIVAKLQMRNASPTIIVA